MAKKASNQLREPSPSAIPPSSTTAYKTQSSASFSQSHTTSTSAAKGNTAVPSKSVSTPSKPAAIPTKATNMPSKAQARTSKQAQNIQDIATSIWNRYVDETPQRVKIIDAFMGFLMLLGAVQFVYCVIAGNYPFNAFLSGFSATVGQFVLTASLRIQTNPENKKGNFEGISDERAFADFVLGSLILHLFCINFIN